MDSLHWEQMKVLVQGKVVRVARNMGLPTKAVFPKAKTKEEIKEARMAKIKEASQAIGHAQNVLPVFLPLRVNALNAARRSQEEKAVEEKEEKMEANPVATGEATGHAQNVEPASLQARTHASSAVLQSLEVAEEVEEKEEKVGDHQELGA